jgi:hypothetical protein
MNAMSETLTDPKKGGKFKRRLDEGASGDLVAKIKFDVELLTSKPTQDKPTPRNVERLLGLTGEELLYLRILGDLKWDLQETFDFMGFNSS